LNLRYLFSRGVISELLVFSDSLSRLQVFAPFCTAKTTIIRRTANFRFDGVCGVKNHLSGAFLGFYAQNAANPRRLNKGGKETASFRQFSLSSAGS
jgi:hypothetical protein